MNVRPVFIGGCPRTGTTLLGSLLAQVNGAVAPPESQFVSLIYRQMQQGRVTLASALDRIQNHTRFLLWNWQPDESTREHIRSASDSYASLIEGLIWYYAVDHGHDPSRPLYWIDHTPHNICHLTILRRLFPEAHFVHLMRDGRGVAASLLPLDWGPNSTQKAARFWMRMTGIGLAAAWHLPEERLQTISYEALVRDPRNVLSGLMRFAQLPAAEEASYHGRLNLPEYTRHQHERVGQPPDPERATAWRKRLTPQQIETFEAIAGSMLSYLGYPLDYGNAARMPGAVAQMKSDLYEFVCAYSRNLIKTKWRQHRHARP